MFGLLNPLAFWLAPLLAAPLVIHLLGRSQPRLRDFPSLMPVKGRLNDAMRRHRLKNWLQLLLRTLALLFLLLAAANPLWRSRNGFAPPAATGLLIHNGAYSAVPLTRAETIFEAEQRMQRGLDSLTPGQSHAELLLPDAPNREPAARFGGYTDALSRLLKEAEGQPSFHLFIPVFAWRDLEESRELLARELERNPGLRIVLTEYPDARKRLAPFSGFSLSFPVENTAALRVRTLIAPRSSLPVLWTPAGGTPREVPVGKDSVEILMPFSQAGWLRGELTLPSPPGDDFAFPSVAICARIPPPSTLCHVGNAFASLASLGRGGLRMRIKPLTDARGLESESCDFLYLADPKETDAALLSRAAEIVRGGGKVILGLGRNADIALLNRNLLDPLRIGRLTELKQHGPIPVKNHAEAFASLRIRVRSWGEPGQVQAHIGLQRDTGATVLLSAGDDPILIHRRFGSGALLLWTTDVNDPKWTDLGLGPWVALMHQAFVSGDWISGPGVQRIASDSTMLVSAESGEILVTNATGAPFQRLRRDPEGWRIGPFDRLGLYRVESGPEKGRDTSWLAVGLTPERFQPDDGAKDRFLSPLGILRSRFAIRDVDDDWRNLYAGFRLRLGMLTAAALLLFLEGLVSLRLRPAPLAAQRD